MASFQSDSSFLNLVRENQVRSYHNQGVIVGSVKEESKGRHTQSDEGEDVSFLYLHRHDLQHISPQEISFQKDFHAQHIKTSHLILQKFKESIPHTLKRSYFNAISSTHEQTLPKNCKIILSEVIKRLETHDPMVDHNQVMKDLKRERDLEQFLSYMIERYCEELYSLLISMAVDVWKQVRSLNLKQLQLHEFRKLAVNFTNTKSQTIVKGQYFQRLKQPESTLQFPDNQSEMSNARELIKCWSTTILCILGGFFLNPYSSGIEQGEQADWLDYPKRQSSSVSIDFMSYGDILSDQQFSLQPVKKVKSQ